VGEGIVLHVSSILTLIAADDCVIIVVHQFGSVMCLTVFHIEVTSCVYNVLRDLQTDIPVDRAPSVFIVPRIIVEACNFIS
jgi:hypothetical protein